MSTKYQVWPPPHGFEPLLKQTREDKGEDEKEAKVSEDGCGKHLYSCKCWRGNKKEGVHTLRDQSSPEFYTGCGKWIFFFFFQLLLRICRDAHSARGPCRFSLLPPTQGVGALSGTGTSGCLHLIKNRFERLVKCLLKLTQCKQCPHSFRKLLLV